MHYIHFSTTNQTEQIKKIQKNHSRQKTHTQPYISPVKKHKHKNIEAVYEVEESFVISTEYSQALCIYYSTAWYSSSCSHPEHCQNLANPASS